MTPETLTIPMYAAGFFNLENPDPQQQDTIRKQLEQIAGSGITRLILFGLNPPDPASFDGKTWTYGCTPILTDGQYANDLDPALPQLLADLKTSGGVREIYFSIGGAGSVGIYQSFQKLFQEHGTGPENPMYGSLQVLAQTLSVDGYDLDLEPSDPDLQGTVVDMGQLLANLGLQGTYAPYEGSSFWVDCLAQTYSQVGSQPIVGWHLQCYGGGCGNDPATWVQALRSAGSSTGVSDPAAFVLPGFETVGTKGNPPQDNCKAVPKSCIFGPQDFLDRFTQYRSADPGIAGGFLWQYGRILDSQTDCTPPGPGPEAYAQAIAQGILGPARSGGAD